MVFRVLIYILKYVYRDTMRRVQNTEDALNVDDDDNDETTMMMTMMPTMRMLEILAITMIIKHYRLYFAILF